MRDPGNEFDLSSDVPFRTPLDKVPGELQWATLRDLGNAFYLSSVLPSHKALDEYEEGIQFIICNLRISAQFSVPIGRKAKEFHLLLHIDPDVVPEEVVIGHMPVFHGKHAGSKDPERLDPQHAVL